MPDDDLEELNVDLEDVEKYKEYVEEEKAIF